MRFLLTSLCLLLISSTSFARNFRDTVYSPDGDKVIISYSVVTDDDKVTVTMNAPRIIPTQKLRNSCKGDLNKLKAVVFDRIGSNGEVKWNGMKPTAFTVPTGMSYDKSSNGYYILGESLPITFTKQSKEKKTVNMPVYLAAYQRKRTYKILSRCTTPLSISVGSNAAATTRRKVRQETETELVAVHSEVEVEADNADVTKALSSISMVQQMLQSATELPFSESLKMEIYNLRSLRDRLTDQDVIERIDMVLMEYNDKEQELKESAKDAALSAQAQQQAAEAQLRQEAEAKEKEAEEKARIQEEKQQKRTLWMIIGGVALAVLGFIGNGIFKHFRDVANQKNIMKMQESIAAQAQHEAGRRAREVVRNKAHRVVKKGENQIRASIGGNASTPGKPKPNTKRKSI